MGRRLRLCDILSPDTWRPPRIAGHGFRPACPIAGAKPDRRLTSTSARRRSLKRRAALGAILAFCLHLGLHDRGDGLGVHLAELRMPLNHRGVRTLAEDDPRALEPLLPNVNGSAIRSVRPPEPRAFVRRFGSGRAAEAARRASAPVQQRVLHSPRLPAAALFPASKQVIGQHGQVVASQAPRKFDMPGRVSPARCPATAGAASRRPSDFRIARWCRTAGALHPKRAARSGRQRHRGAWRRSPKPDFWPELACWRLYHRRANFCKYML